MTREVLERAIGVILTAVDPARVVAGPAERLLADAARIVVLGFGKASARMCAGVASDPRVVRGVVLATPEEADRVGGAIGPVEVLASDHPRPTARNEAGARRLADAAGGVGAGAWALVLISGGGSAHLALPRDGLRGVELSELTDGLLRSGASIEEINCVRRHCEQLKGGGLARRLLGADGVAAIAISDVPGDDPAVIASGPVSGDTTTFADALGVLRRHALLGACPTVTAHLERGARGAEPETARPGDAAVARVAYAIAASGSTAADAAARMLRAEGMDRVEVATGVHGPARDVGRELGRRVTRMRRGAAIVWAGETTVRLNGHAGCGGRNQEVALAAALELDGARGAGVLALATDGVDGPTEAGGAIVDGGTVARIRARGRDAAADLLAHQSGRSLAASGDRVVIGPTGTNVSDVLIGVRPG